MIITEELITEELIQTIIVSDCRISAIGHG